MYEFLKDGAEAFSQRLRSPIIGSIILAVLLLNWKALLYLVFADQPVAVKFHFFDMNTTAWTLYILPVAIGVTYAFAVPWVRLAGAWVAKTPTDRLRKLQSDTALDQKIYRSKKEAELEKAEADAEAAREQRKIDAADRLKQAEEIDGSRVAEEIKEEREKQKTVDLADIANHETETAPFTDLNPIEMTVIEAMEKVDSEVTPWSLTTKQEQVFKDVLGLIIPNLTQRRLEAELKSAYQALSHRGYVTSNSHDVLLTAKGYAAADYINQASRPQRS